MNHSSRFHPLAWIAWTALSAVAVQAMTNPVALFVAIAALLYTAVRLAPDRGPVVLMLKVGVFVTITRVLLFGLAGHPGGATLFTLPSLTVPALLGGFRIGGAISSEVLATSAIEGIRLAAVLICFGVFLSAVEPARVVRLVPRFLFEAGLIVAIGATFVPSLVRTARDVREAQRLRGYRARGLRAAAAIALPVLSTTLERASSIAESMESRGYGRARTMDARRESRARLGAFVGVAVAVAGGAGATMGLRPMWAAWAAVAGGVAVLAAASRTLAAHALRTRYRRERAGPADIALIAIAVVQAALVVVFRARFAYEPSLGLTVPALSVMAVVVACLLAAPVVVDAIRGLRLRTLSLRAEAEAEAELELEPA